MQRLIAHKLQTQQSSISRYERGELPLDVRSLWLWEQALGLPPGEVFARVMRLQEGVLSPNDILLTPVLGSSTPEAPAEAVRGLLEAQALRR